MWCFLDDSLVWNFSYVCIEKQVNGTFFLILKNNLQRIQIIKLVLSINLHNGEIDKLILWHLIL